MYVFIEYALVGELATDLFSRVDQCLEDRTEAGRRGKMFQFEYFGSLKHASWYGIPYFIVEEGNS